jgi:hypothetical protein
MKALQKGNGVLEQVAGVPIIHSNSSTGTGSDQQISHGFSEAPDRLELIPIDTGTIFSGLSVEGTHFHVTVTAGKNWGWMAQKW